MKFQKKPLIVEAFQLTEASRNDNSGWPEWMHEAWNKSQIDVGAVYPAGYPVNPGLDPLKLNLEPGVAVIPFGDWIIRGLGGELYPCSDAVFVASYDPVDDVVEAEAEAEIEAVVEAPVVDPEPEPVVEAPVETPVLVTEDPAPVVEEAAVVEPQASVEPVTEPVPEPVVEAPVVAEEVVVPEVQAEVVEAPVAKSTKASK